MNDLSSAYSEHDDVGKHELAGGCAGAQGFLLDDDRAGIVRVVDGQRPVTLVLDRAGLPHRGRPAHDLVSALEPGWQAWARERELMDRFGRVQTTHVMDGLTDGGLAPALQHLTRT